MTRSNKQSQIRMTFFKDAKQFKTERIQPGQTYLYFAKQQKAAFYDLLSACEVQDLKELLELMMLEHCKQSLP